MRDAMISIAVLGALMLGARLLFGRRRAPPAPLHVPPAAGAFTLRPRRRHALLIGATAFVPAAVLGLFAIEAWPTGGMGFAWAALATLVAFAAAAYLMASWTRSHLVVRDLGIERVGVFRRRLIAWSSIAKITFNPAQSWFFVTISDGSHLWLPLDLAGMGDFAALALRRLQRTVLDADPATSEVLDELARAARTQATHAG